MGAGALHWHFLCFLPSCLAGSCCIKRPDLGEGQLGTRDRGSPAPLCSGPGFRGSRRRVQGDVRRSPALPGVREGT